MSRMSTPINLDLDFQDYTPNSHDIDAKQKTIPSKQSKTPTKPQDNRTNTSSSSHQSNASSILNILQGVPIKSGISDEALRQLSWASGGTAIQKPPRSANSANWGLNYLAKYFDVTTDDVLERIMWSMFPIRKKGIQVDVVNDDDLIAPLAGPAGLVSSDSVEERFDTSQKPHSYMERFIQSRPDLYGPFWISTTLIFSVAIFSNIISFFNHKSQAERISMIEQNNVITTNHTAEAISSQVTFNLDDWHYSMDEFNTMSSVVMMYATLLPTLISFLFWFRGCNKYYTLTETICAYGYSMSIYVPLSALFMIQVMPFRYLLLALTSLASGSVLMFSFLPVARSDPNSGGSHIILAIIFACHFGLAYIMHRLMLQ